MGRVTLELLGGTVAGLSLGLVGLAIGSGANPCNDNDSSRCYTPLLVGGILGMTLGIPTGVFAVGSWMDGRGGYLASLLGTIIGAGLGALIAVSTNDPIAAGIGLTVGPFGGAVLGYEMSHARWESSQEPAPRRSSSRAQVMPTLGVTPKGGFFGGLAGAF